MNTPEFLHLVRDMRAAQKRYFSARDNLVYCKAIEQRVDYALAQWFGEPQLFGPRAGDDPQPQATQQGSTP